RYKKLSFPRKRESICASCWIPAFAGMTEPLNPSLFRFSISTVLLHPVFFHEWYLAQGENDGAGQHAEHLETHPEIGGIVAPDKLIERCQKHKIQPPIAR